MYPTLSKARSPRGRASSGPGGTRLGNGAALLYSGGLDSFTSLIRRRDDVRRLVSVWGADVELEDAGCGRSSQKVVAARPAAGHPPHRRAHEHPQRARRPASEPRLRPQLRRHQLVGGRAARALADHDLRPRHQALGLTRVLAREQLSRRHPGALGQHPAPRQPDALERAARRARQRRPDPPAEGQTGGRPVARRAPDAARRLLPGRPRRSQRQLRGVREVPAHRVRDPRGAG